MTSLRMGNQVEQETEITSVVNGEKGLHLSNSMRRNIKKIIQENVKLEPVCPEKQLSSCFKI